MLVARGNGRCRRRPRRGLGGTNSQPSPRCAHSRTQCGLDSQGASSWADDGDQSPKHGHHFAFNVLSGVRTFSTGAQFDLVVHAPAIPWALQQFLEQDAAFQSLVSDVQYYPTLDILSELWGIARPGYFAITPATGPSHGIIVAMPHSYQSGHTVPMRAPAEFLADVRNWYQNTTD